MVLMDIDELEFWRKARKMKVEDLVTRLEEWLELSEIEPDVYLQELKRRLGIEFNLQIQSDIINMEKRQDYGTPESQVIDVDENTLEKLPNWEDELKKRILLRSKSWSIKDMEEMIEKDKQFDSSSLWIPDLTLAIQHKRGLTD